MWRLALLAFLSSAAAQIPSLGWCPEYQQPMPNFDMKRFLGTWYEAERYFSVGDLISRCVTTKYESTPEGRILVSNEIINSLTGMKRVLDGHLSLIGREGEGRMTVKYASLPIPYESEFLMLDTDYDSFAVMWSCSGLGPLHTQNAWVLTRDRIANTATMQAAYGVLDRFKLSRTFFVKTNQGDCNILPEPVAKDQEGKSNVVVEQKSAVVPDVVEVSGKVVEQPIEKRVDSEVKPEVPEERSAVPVPAEPKPMQVPELILSESSEKKEEKKGKPEEKPFKEEKKEEFPVKAALPEKIENESKEKMGDKRE